MDMDIDRSIDCFNSGEGLRARFPSGSLLLADAFRFSEKPSCAPSHRYWMLTAASWRLTQEGGKEKTILFLPG